MHLCKKNSNKIPESNGKKKIFASPCIFPPISFPRGTNSYHFQTFFFHIHMLFAFLQNGITLCVVGCSFYFVLNNVSEFFSVIAHLDVSPWYLPLLNCYSLPPQYGYTVFYLPFLNDRISNFFDFKAAVHLFLGTSSSTCVDFLVDFISRCVTAASQGIHI